METTDRQLRILVVDDQRDNADGLADLLRMHGHEVEVAFDGKQAVRSFREQEFDIAFMDVMMPGINGVESLLEIRKIKPEAKIIIMTGHSETELLDQARDGGVDGVLHKPVRMNEVLEVVERAKSLGMILVADADSDFSANIKWVLEDRGYVVRLARTGTQTLRTVLDGGIDLLMLDLALPGLSGFDVYTQLHRRGRTVPTVVVTGKSAEQTKAVDAFRARYETGVLTKPFAARELFDQMKSAIAAVRTPDEPALESDSDRVSAPVGSAQPQSASVPEPAPEWPGAPAETPQSEHSVAPVLVENRVSAPLDQPETSDAPAFEPEPEQPSAPFESELPEATGVPEPALKWPDAPAEAPQSDRSAAPEPVQDRVSAWLDQPETSDTQALEPEPEWPDAPFEPLLPEATGVPKPGPEWPDIPAEAPQSEHSVAPEPIQDRLSATLDQSKVSDSPALEPEPEWPDAPAETPQSDRSAALEPVQDRVSAWLDLPETSDAPALEPEPEWPDAPAETPQSDRFATPEPVEDRVSSWLDLPASSDTPALEPEPKWPDAPLEPARPETASAPEPGSAWRPDTPAETPQSEHSVAPEPIQDRVSAWLDQPETADPPALEPEPEWPDEPVEPVQPETARAPEPGPAWSDTPVETPESEHSVAPEPVQDRVSAWLDQPESTDQPALEPEPEWPDTPVETRQFERFDAPEPIADQVSASFDQTEAADPPTLEPKPERPDAPFEPVRAETARAPEPGAVWLGTSAETPQSDRSFTPEPLQDRASAPLGQPEAADTTAPEPEPGRPDAPVEPAQPETARTPEPGPVWLGTSAETQQPDLSAAPESLQDRVNAWLDQPEDSDAPALEPQPERPDTPFEPAQPETARAPESEPVWLGTSAESQQADHPVAPEPLQDRVSAPLDQPEASDAPALESEPEQLDAPVDSPLLEHSVVPEPAQPEAMAGPDAPADIGLPRQGAIDMMSNRRILVVNDVGVADGLAGLLRNYGFSVETANTAEEARDVVQRFDAQIALLDVGLGVDNGLDLIPMLREHRPSINHIVLTEIADKDITIEALRSGAFEHLTKPLNLPRLVQTLEKCFEQCEVKEGLEASFEALQKAKAKAEKSNKEATKFLANLSEELRIAMGEIIDSANLINRISQALPDAKEYRNHTRNVCGRAMQVLDTLGFAVDLAKAQAGLIELQEDRIDIASLAAGAAQWVRQGAEGDVAELELAAPETCPSVWGDLRLFEHLLMILLTDAIKFTPPNGHIKLSLRSEDDGGLCIEVCDNGMGIPPILIPNILSSFGRVEGLSSGNHRGAGLGLPLVSAIAEMHDGKLTLDSAPDSDTTATIRLPASRVISTGSSTNSAGDPSEVSAA